MGTTPDAAATEPSPTVKPDNGKLKDNSPATTPATASSENVVESADAPDTRTIRIKPGQNGVESMQVHGITVTTEWSGVPTSQIALLTSTAALSDLTLEAKE